MEKKKLLGIKIIVILILIMSIVVILNILSPELPNDIKLRIIKIKIFKTYNINTIEKYDNRVKAMQRKYSSPSNVSFYIMLLVIAFGLWNLREWGRIGIILFSHLMVILQFLHLITRETVVNRMVSIILFVFFIYYFTCPKVKEQFK